MTTTYSPGPPIWCAGCGHFGVQASLRRALVATGVADHEVLILAGIGCSGTIQNNLGTYGFHALHGRVLPTAIGAHLGNPGLTVIAAGGDGDGYAIGMGHLVHAFRRNPAIVYVLMNNGTYGLTKGQPSPTAAAGGMEGIDGIRLGLAIPGTTFLARGFARWVDQMDVLMAGALRHAREGRGFAFIEVMSPCVTYNDTYPEWESSMTDLDSDGGHDPADRSAAFASSVALAAEGRIPVGLIYHDPGADPAPRAPEVPGSPETHDLSGFLDRYRV